MESKKLVDRIKLISEAYNFINNDSYDGHLTKVKLLGKNMTNAPASDVANYLYEKAEHNPKTIIELYTSQDSSLRLLLIDSMSKRIIVKQNGVYRYGDSTLGLTEESVIMFLKMSENNSIFISIRNETYPDMFEALAFNTLSLENTELGKEVTTEPQSTKTIVTSEDKTVSVDEVPNTVGFKTTKIEKPAKPKVIKKPKSVKKTIK